MMIPRTLYQGRFLSLLQQDRWEYASRTNARAVVVIVALSPRNELVLVEQYRVPVGRHVIELPAGLVGDQGDSEEPLLLAAERELLEETGFEADEFKVLMSCPSSAGMSDEIVTFVRALGLRRVGEGGGDSTEDILVHLVPLDEVGQFVAAQQARGVLLDPKIFGVPYWLALEGQASP